MFCRAVILKVRQAREPDFEAVANLRTVIVPIGMDGTVGFMGSKVVIDDPVEAKRRRLMAKVTLQKQRPLYRIDMSGLPHMRRCFRCARDTTTFFNGYPRGASRTTPSCMLCARRLVYTCARRSKFPYGVGTCGIFLLFVL